MLFIPRSCGAPHFGGGHLERFKPDPSLTATTKAKRAQVTTTSTLREIVRTHFDPAHPVLPSKTLVGTKPREMGDKGTDFFGGAR